MTHFGVLVRVPSATPIDDFSTVLTKMLEPWQEHACTGACPIEFMEFTDVEDEYVQEYDDEHDEFVDLGEAPPGYVTTVGPKRERETERVFEGRRLVRSWDEMFRDTANGPAIGIGSNTHKVPDHYPRVQFPHKRLHATLEEFVASYHGCAERDPIKKRYGRWENPKKKWDYWRPIRNKMPSRREGMTDICRISELDGDVIARMTREKSDRVWSMIDDVRAGRMRAGEAFWEMDARRTALDYGVLLCVTKDKLTPEIEARYRCVSQERRDTMVVYDCWDDRMTREIFDTIAIGKCHPLSTWAQLERKEGGWGNTEWIEPGNMGWWACHDASADAIISHARKFLEWLAGGDREDFVIMVDCHI